MQASSSKKSWRWTISTTTRFHLLSEYAKALTCFGTTPRYLTEPSRSPSSPWRMEGRGWKGSSWWTQRWTVPAVQAPASCRRLSLFQSPRTGNAEEKENGCGETGGDVGEAVTTDKREETRVFVMYIASIFLVLFSGSALGWQVEAFFYNKIYVGIGPICMAAYPVDIGSIVNIWT